MSFLTARPIFHEAFFAVKPDASCGALATFFGIVRNHHEGRSVSRLYYECYHSMADRRLRLIKDEIEDRWNLGSLRILHRIGTLEIGETALAVAVAAPHRAEAFSACEETVERIKREVPIWKKEFYEDGTCLWVSCAHAEAASS